MDCMELKTIKWPEEKQVLIDFISSRRKGIPPQVLETVSQIIAEVREKGDAALFHYTEKFDGVKLNAANIEVTPEEIEQAYRKQTRNFRRALSIAADRIRSYHSRYLAQSNFYTDDYGNLLGRLVVPVERAGVYVPGGRAAYPSTALMTVVPAKVAGVKEVVVCIPPLKNGKVNEKTLAALYVAQPDRVFRIGGAQAIAALAYGTETIPAVDVIAGPGNIFVAAAKKLVYGDVGIDMIAGPSEVAIIVGEDVNPEWIAYDLMAQAEHDPNASAFLIALSQRTLKKIIERLKKLVPKSERSHIVREALSNNGWCILVDSIEAAIEVANTIAPEHLELEVENPLDLLSKIKAAGAVFLGSLTAESFGDYLLGPNHTLPTQATARFSSPLSAHTFMKEISVASMTQQGVLALYPHLKEIARAEGLHEHHNAARARYRQLKKKQK